MKKQIIIVLLILLMGVTLLSCADTAPAASPDGTTAATTTAVTTADRDTLTKPDLSEIEVEIIEAMWAKYKSQAESYFTINDISLNRFFEPCGDGYVLFVTDFIPPADMLWEETIEEYEFRYSNITQLYYYLDGEFYTLQMAYASKMITDDQLRTVWEAYKVKFPSYYKEGNAWDETEE